MNPAETAVWNRANGVSVEQPFDPDGLPPGLRDLAALLRFHNAAMGGGLSFAVETADAGLIDLAMSACAYFGLPDVGQVLERVRDAGEDYDAIEGCTDEYYEATDEAATGPSTIEVAFQRRFASSASDFTGAG